MRRKRTALSAALLALATIAVAEAALLAVLVVFSYILKIDLTIELGPFGAVYSSGPNAGPVVWLYTPAVVAAVIVSAASGLASATWTFRRWRPAR